MSYISYSDELFVNLVCNLTGKIFLNPVVAKDGMTYERDAMTGEKLTSPFYDNLLVKKFVDEFLKNNPSLKKLQYGFQKNINENSGNKCIENANSEDETTNDKLNSNKDNIGDVISEGKDEITNDSKHFKLLDKNGNSMGTFSESTPMQAASKAFTKLVNDNLNKTSKENFSSSDDENIDADDKCRYFKVKDLDSNKFVGKYCGNTPKQAASKAYTKLVQIKHQTNDGTILDKNIICLKEYTKTKPHKLFYYEVSRQKLDDPQTLKIFDKDTNETRTIYYSYRNKIKKIKNPNI
ncbi:MAG: hypothetical protein Satyrvirus1_14 [Satyrvirus sp.]|uniref:Uncharacterized protein n=1 Tax=Satyrvirus sp. TaxID=2487771 RepID=A0A3G5ACG3_9VIRU|nr:MAG: hypothetical protein Satyrvirus1_14 [Satyrvirus sp.]